MKKLIFCLSLVCAALCVSCVDKNELVDEESLPSWLGESVYSVLQNPGSNSSLTGTFNTYRRLIDDLGYAEVMSRTGSVTVFPANDDAFQRFFDSGTWPGVSRYEDLSVAQKKMLLYTSMLSNAMLVSTLANTSDNGKVATGVGVKHTTQLAVIDSVTFYPGSTIKNTYKANSYFSRFNNGAYVVSDATRPMVVHFTRDYMINNSITTSGDGSDFSILVGGEYNSGDAYVFRNKIIAPDITCQNGYIHQVENVVTPEGNIAQVLANTPNTQLFSRMLNRFAVPVYNATVTRNYQNWYEEQVAVGNTQYAQIDSIYEIRYLSDFSHGTINSDGSQGASTSFNTPPNSSSVASDVPLTYDPGWNEYYVSEGVSSSSDAFLKDIAAVFVPTDDAITDYFVNGLGKAIMARFAKLDNTPENIASNLDGIRLNVVSALLSNLMKKSFTQSVPSKFGTIVDDASDFMGLTTDHLATDSTGSYDIKIANNGVIYLMDEVIGPKKHVAVSAPALFESNMGVVNWIIENITLFENGNLNPYALYIDFYAYLLAMSANYGLFLPTDESFYVVNPATLKSESPECIRFTRQMIQDEEEWDELILAERMEYDPETNTVGSSLGMMNLSNTSDMAIVRALLVDLINYCTVSLPSGQSLGSNGNRFYKTKHGGEILLNFTANDSTVCGGAQVNSGVAPSVVTTTYLQENGLSYAIDTPIQGPFQSIYSVLSSNEQFSEFFQLCDYFSTDDLLKWAGISDEKDQETGVYPIDEYKVFYVPGQRDNANRCLDYNIGFLSSYNYTVFAPNNEAMQAAYAAGLPRWDEIIEMYQYGGNPNQAKEMIDAIRRFVRYHFITTSVYADNVVESGNYSTFLVNETSNYNSRLAVGGGNGLLTVTDAAGDTKTIDANGTRLVNRMTRDFELDQDRASATYATSQAFAVVHELSAPLYYNAARDFSVSGTVSSAEYQE